VPGSPSSALTTSSRGAGCCATSRHCARWEAGPAQTAQARVVELAQRPLRVELARGERPQQPVAAGRAIRVRVLRGGHRTLARTAFERVANGLGARALHRMSADHRHRGRVAASHAGHAHDAHAGAQRARQPFDQRSLPANAHDNDSHTRTVSGGRRRFAVAHDVEVVIERGDLEHLGLGEPHGLGQRGEHRRREVAVGVLQAMQVLDQQVAAPRRLASSARTRSRAAGSTCRPLGEPTGRRKWITCMAAI